MIGFDIGTTHCKVASVDSTGKPVLVHNARGEPTTPSVVYVPPTGDPLVGTDALEQGALDPENCLRNFKLDLGSTENLLNNGRMVTPTDATAMLVAPLKKDIESALNIEVTEAVVTCPANFRDHQKQPLQEAFERNGIKVLKLVPEPTAAGIAYALGKQGAKLNYLVYDCGGGTTDISVISLDGSQVSVLATEGVSRLGGNDMSRCIEERALDEVQAKCGTRPTRQSEPLFFHDLAGRIEGIKASLCKQKSVPLVLSFNGRQIILPLGQDWFHLAIQPLIQQSLDAVDRAIAAAGLTTTQLNHLVLVGGPCRIPYVQQAVANHTGLTPSAGVDPGKVVAYGGALAAVAEMAKDGRTATIHGRVIPAPDMFVRDVTAHAVGCCVVDDSTSNRRLVQSVIIPKNTAIPCQKIDQFYLENEDQTEARVEILQGEPEAEREDCLLIGELVLDALPRAQKRTKRIQVEYTIDANGMVTATATDKVGGQQKTVSVDYKKGIKPKPKPKVV